MLHWPPIMHTLRHGSSLRRSFVRAVFAATLLPPCAVIACSGGSGDLPTEPAGEKGSQNGGSQNGSATGPKDDDAGKCRAAETVDAGIGCTTYDVKLTGDLSTCDVTDGFGSREFCEEVCGGYVDRCRIVGSNGDVVAECSSACPVDGRRNALLDAATAPSERDVGSSIARMAFFEAASIDSFALLERELKAHGAPKSLLRSCANARKDEVVHARMATRIARRHGADVVKPPPVPWVALRSLEDIAIENAIEGCVRETFGVLVGLWQSRNAPTRELRAFFGKLAADESRHAALANRVDGWLRSRLSAEECRRVDAARDRALSELYAALASEPLEGLGYPSSREARQLFASWLATESTGVAA